MTLNVIINGGGIGGLTAALACSKKGFSVSAHEQADGFFEVGAGLQISPNASRVLGDLGLVDELAKRSFTPKALEMRIGSTVLRIPTCGPRQQQTMCSAGIR